MILLCLFGCFACIYVYAAFACLVSRGAGRRSWPFRNIVVDCVSCYVSAGNQTQVLWKSPLQSLTPDPSLQPYNLGFLIKMKFWVSDQRAQKSMFILLMPSSSFCSPSSFQSIVTDILIWFSNIQRSHQKIYLAHWLNYWLKFHFLWRFKNTQSKLMVNALGMVASPPYQRTAHHSLLNHFLKWLVRENIEQRNINCVWLS